jgi:hypothetical protein
MIPREPPVALQRETDLLLLVVGIQEPVETRGERAPGVLPSRIAFTNKSSSHTSLLISLVLISLEFTSTCRRSVN